MTDVVKIFIIFKPKFVEINLIIILVRNVNGFLFKLLPTTIQKKLLGVYKTLIIWI